MFFDENWTSKAQIISYGHDIEASWLIDEAARVMGDKELLAEVQKICLSIAEAACEGLQTDGSLIYERIKPKTILIRTVTGGYRLKLWLAS